MTQQESPRARSRSINQPSAWRAARANTERTILEMQHRVATRSNTRPAHDHEHSHTGTCSNVSGKGA
jgi:hypothetical protein